MRQLNSIKSSVDLAIDLANNNTYNFYLDELEAASLIDASDYEKTSEDTTVEEVEEEISKLPELDFLLTDQNSSSDTSYSEAKTTYANYTHSGGTLDLNGQTLTVYGDFYLTGGTLNVHGGTLEVRGDLYLQGGNLYLNGGTVTVGGNATLAKINSDGSYSHMSSSGYLTMDNDADLFTVGGNLVTCFYGGSYFQGSAGEMKIGGNWTNYQGYTGSKVSCSGTFKMTFTGTDDVTIYGSHSVYIPTITIENASERNITMRGTVTAGSLIGNNLQITAKNIPVLSFDNVIGGMTIDGSVNLAVPTKAVGSITINGDLYSSGLTMGANTLTVNGDLYLNTNKTLIFGASGNLNVSGDVWMKAGSLSLGNSAAISGSVYQAGGDLKVNKSTVNIAGDYRIQNTDESTGEFEWVNSSGNLYMTNDSGCIIVGGNFHMQSTNSRSGKLTAGTLVVLGDFFQHAGNAANFAASGTHTVLLCGSGSQTVTFESTGSHFNILQLSGYAENYTFNPNPCWNTLEEAVEIPDEYYGNVIAEGSCGSAVTYAFTENGVLIISGSGTMKNYTSKSSMPWYSWMDQIKTVVIKEGVTSIGDYAFYGMPNLTSIIIPESVTSIGAYAFKNSTALKGAALPSGLTKLGESAFYGCTSLTSIDIPASLWTVQPYTFKNCTALESVTFHEGNLMKISDGAFYNTALTTVELPDCLTILDVYSFKNCADLASVKLSAGLTQIREASLYGTAISEITIPEGVTSIKPYAFKNCVNLSAVSLPSTLTTVEEAAFYACTKLASVELPNAVTTIGSYAFRKCTGLTSVDFGSGLTTIGESSFYDCTGLTELAIPEKVTTIGAYAFKGCTAVTSVSLPDSLVTLGDSAFHTCTSLDEITIPANVTRVGEYCFSGSTGIDYIYFLGDAPTIGSGAFNKLTATAYYPSGNSTWTASVKQNYGGTITWKAN